MQEKQYINQIKVILNAQDKLIEERKSINNAINSSRKDIETKVRDEENELKREDLIEHYNTVDKMIVKRKAYNSKIQDLQADMKSCAYWVGEFDKTQLHFPFDADDPEKFSREVKKAKLSKKVKNNKDSEEDAA